MDGQGCEFSLAVDSIIYIVDCASNKQCNKKMADDLNVAV